MTVIGWSATLPSFRASGSSALTAASREANTGSRFIRPVSVRTRVA
jgi:hypothetical protein